MHKVLGLDTSNYTTSAAVYDTETETVCHRKKLLPVKKGQMGLRQSDAVFHHTQQLPGILESLMEETAEIPEAVGVSVRPRDVEGSYMPCFTVGAGAARSLAAVLHIPIYMFSHQAGHIAAALYSAGRLDLLNQEFLAFHVSGGTTEAVLVKPHPEMVISCQLVAETLDLNAGQVIDRVGGILDLPFPAGPYLERLALSWDGKIEKVHPMVKGTNCCLSGVENLCQKKKEQKEPPQRIARFCLDYVEETLAVMCRRLLEQYGRLPVLFAGGVMSNGMIRERFEKEFNGIFAQPEFSADNAAGIAVLTAIKAGWR